MSECLFCKIVAGEIPSTPVAESDTALAIRDIDPQAPVHVLVIPKVHLTSADQVSAGHAGIVDDLVLLAQRVAELGAQITADYADDPPLLVAVLKALCVVTIFMHLKFDW